MKYEIPSGILTIDDVDRLVKNSLKFFKGDDSQRAEKAWGHVWDVLEDHSSEITSWAHAYTLVSAGLGVDESISSESRRKIQQEQGLNYGSREGRNLRIR